MCALPGPVTWRFCVGSLSALLCVPLLPCWVAAQGVVGCILCCSHLIATTQIPEPARALWCVTLALDWLHGMGLGTGATRALGTKRQHASCTAACRMTPQAEGAGGGEWSHQHCLATCAVAAEGKVRAWQATGQGKSRLAASKARQPRVMATDRSSRVWCWGSWWRRQRCRCIHRMSGMPLLVCTGCFVCVHACMRVSVCGCGVRPDGRCVYLCGVGSKCAEPCSASAAMPARVTGMWQMCSWQTD